MRNLTAAFAPDGHHDQRGVSRRGLALRRRRQTTTTGTTTTTRRHDHHHGTTATDQSHRFR